MKMSINRFFVSAVVAGFLAGFSGLAGTVASAESFPDLPTVQNVNLERYMGKWYEIAALPQVFQQGCFATAANYSLRKNGTVQVINTCNKGSVDGPVTTAKGKAWVVDRKTNAKLKVSFQWPFAGDYWILALDNDYTYALVGTPDRKSLWILARTPVYEQSVVDGLLNAADWYGFDTAAMNWTVH